MHITFTFNGTEFEVMNFDITLGTGGSISGCGGGHD